MCEISIPFIQIDTIKNKILFILEKWCIALQ